MIHVAPGRPCCRRPIPRTVLPRGPVSVALMSTPILPGTRRRANRQLAAEHRCCESVGRQEDADISAWRMKAGNDGGVLCLQRLCRRRRQRRGEWYWKVAAHAGPTWHGGEAAHGAGQPEADAAGVGLRAAAERQCDRGEQHSVSPAKARRPSPR